MMSKCERGLGCLERLTHGACKGQWYSTLSLHTGLDVTESNVVTADYTSSEVKFYKLKMTQSRSFHCSVPL